MPLPGISTEMEDGVLAEVGADHDGAPDEAAKIWDDIVHDLRTSGPLSKLILKFRDDAAEANGALVNCRRHKYATDAEHSAAVTKWQDLLERLTSTIKVIHTFREATEGIEGNEENSTEDGEYLRRYVTEDY